MGSSEEVRAMRLDRPTVNLFGRSGEESLLKAMLRKEILPKEYQSKQGVSQGLKPHPFDMCAVKEFRLSNEYHSTCILTKVQATVGLGHVTEQKKAERRAKASGELPKPTEKTEISSKVDKILNPLCDSTWQETLGDVGQDFYDTGNGYLEVIRKGGDGKITGLHHIPAADVHIYIENDLYDKHYVIQGSEENGSASTRVFAEFGDKKAFIERAKEASGPGGIDLAHITAARGKDGEINEDLISEVIHFRQPTSMSKWYGYPDWLAAVASVELVQMMMQHNFDFFLNRGVPEFLALFLGQKIETEEWKKIEDTLRQTIGLGNSHKTMAINLNVPPEFKVQIEKLAMQQGEGDMFSSMRENLALGIVSAHRVPPLLAGIQIPGKLGATNELPNALMAFQILVVGPAQRLIQQTLGQTLGDPASGLGLTVEDFEFVKITEEIDVGQMDTVARMRQSPMQAKSEGRNLSAGVKD